MSKLDNLAVNTIRILSAESVQKAKSGHPGLPMGSAPIAWALYARTMKHNPKNPDWTNRDRFILSAGHASMLLYSMLHIFGYGLTMNDLQNFRQWGSPCAGHPEFGHAKGIETTTGPLGQGVSNAVGMALAEAHMAAKFNREGFPIVNHYTYCLAGDGCLMEGISSEACSLAATMKLRNLVVIYDSNEITIEGSTSFAFTEDVGKRYEAYGWNVLNVQDGNDPEAIAHALDKAKSHTMPTLIIVNTQIAYGSPLAGSAKAHGEPLGEDNIKLTREKLCYDCPPFSIPKDVQEAVASIVKENENAEKEWCELFARFAKKYPDLAKAWEEWHEGTGYDPAKDDSLYEFPGVAAMATRASSGEVLNRIAAKMPNLIGGSADLGPSNKSVMKGREYFSPADYSGSNIHYGVREFAMAGIANGIALYGGLKTYVATFFVFTDYLKSALRSAALMGLPVTYVMTHDSIGVGEDGPTHQPIEQLAMVRAMPNVTDFRPCDAKETAAGYIAAMTAKGPTVLALSRQDLPILPETGKEALKGGYILKDAINPDIVLLASGSEVELIYKAADVLAEKGIKARVVSIPSFKLFEEQGAGYKAKVLGKGVKRLAVEAAASFGWHKYVGEEGDVIALDHFGASAPAKILFKEFGFTVENVVDRALKLLGK